MAPTGILPSRQQTKLSNRVAPVAVYGPHSKEAIIEMCSNLKWHKKQSGQNNGSREGKEAKKAKAQQLPRQSARTYGPNGACCQKCSWPKRFPPPRPFFIYFMLCLFDLKLVGRLGSGLSSGRANINISSQ